ncbi:hypothetical protein Tco_0523810 [Tanacetum coccineum]
MMEMEMEMEEWKWKMEEMEMEWETMETKWESWYEYGRFDASGSRGTFQDFLSCKPNNSQELKALSIEHAGLRRWRLCSIISIVQRSIKVKYASCTLQDSGFDWWTLIREPWEMNCGSDCEGKLTWTDYTQRVSGVDLLLYRMS